MQGRDQFTAAPGCKACCAGLRSPSRQRRNCFQVRAEDWLADHALAEEVFGPLGLIVTVRDAEEMLAFASRAS